MGFNIAEEDELKQLMLAEENATGEDEETDIEEDDEEQVEDDDSGNISTDSQRSDDPVRTYLRAMGYIELLSREGEIAIAKRIEVGRKLMIEGLCDSPMTIRSLLKWHESLIKEEMQLREIVDLETMYGGEEPSGSELEEAEEERVEAEEELQALEENKKTSSKKKDKKKTDNNEDDAKSDEEKAEEEDLEIDEYDDGVNVSLASMEESLMPTVLETFEKIKKTFPKLRRLQEKKN